MKTSRLRSRHWAELATRTDSFAQMLSAEAVACPRKPSRLSDAQDHGLAERLQRCVAFGQHLQRLSTQNQEFGQFGLYGTAAGLELIAASGLAREIRDKPVTHWSEDTRVCCQVLMRTWNFLDVVITHFADIESSKFWDQSRTTLRLCQVLRAIAAVRPVLAALADPAKHHFQGCDPRVTADFGQTFGEAAATRMAAVLHAQLRQAAVAANSALFDSSVVTLHNVRTVRFGCDSDEVAQTIEEWLFLWSSMLIAMVRASRSGVLSRDQSVEICGFDDIQNLWAVVRTTSVCDDDRYRLFALCALTEASEPHRHVGPATDGFRYDPDDFLTSDVRGWAELNRQLISQEAVRTCQRLLRTDMTLVDVHSPYQVFFGERRQGEKFRDDYYVIPVLPVLMRLIAQHRPTWLFRPRIAGLLNSWLTVADRRQSNGSLRALPFQVGAYTGTVNALYYREAAIAVARALESIARQAWYRTPLGFVTDYAVATVVVGAASMLWAGSVIGLWLVGWSVGPLLTFLLGLAGGYTANASTYYFFRWLERREG